ncbi:hypothetical protein D3C80_2132370 [compost metagenome]
MEPQDVLAHHLQPSGPKMAPFGSVDCSEIIEQCIDPYIDDMGFIAGYGYAPWLAGVSGNRDVRQAIADPRHHF